MTKQRRSRFLFPGLLACVVAALLAVGMMWMPYQRKREQCQREQPAVREIERMGGSVKKEWLGTVVEVIFTSQRARRDVSDAGLEHLKGLTNLRGLAFGYTQVSDAGIEHLKGLTNLRALSLGSTQVTDAGLEHLKGLTNLRQLYLHDTQVTDAGLEHLKGLTNLEYLYLPGTHVGAAGAEKLKNVIGDRLFIERRSPGY
jgi:hypothetical protein